MHKDNFATLYKFSLFLQEVIFEMICIQERRNTGIDVKLFLAKPPADIIRLFIERNLLHKQEMNEMLFKSRKSTEECEVGSTIPLHF
jgi:hypothetical protein